MILVSGFGPFPGVPDNPTAALARAIDGRRVAGETVVGIVLPVSYARGPAEVIRHAQLLGPRLVVGLGVASQRAKPCVERTGRRAANPERPDVDGVALDRCGDGPEIVRATADVARLAKALKAEISDDAGGYVCNAWLWTVVQALPGTPVAFVHVPPAGLPVDRLLGALA